MTTTSHSPLGCPSQQAARMSGQTLQTPNPAFQHDGRQPYSNGSVPRQHVVGYDGHLSSCRAGRLGPLNPRRAASTSARALVSAATVNPSALVKSRRRLELPASARVSVSNRRSSMSYPLLSPNHVEAPSQLFEIARLANDGRRCKRHNADEDRRRIADFIPHDLRSGETHPRVRAS